MVVAVETSDGDVKLDDRDMSDPKDGDGGGKISANIDKPPTPMVESSCVVMVRLGFDSLRRTRSRFVSAVEIAEAEY
jgi:hypothetical protein